MFRLIKLHVSGELDACRDRILAHINIKPSSSSPTATGGDGSSSSPTDAGAESNGYFFSGANVLVFVEARTTVSKLAPLIALLHTRSRLSNTYQDLFQDCQRLFLQHRKLLNSEELGQFLTSARLAGSLASVMRSSSARAVELGSLEGQLQTQFFGSYDRIPQDALRSAVEGAGQRLYGALRPLIIREKDMDVLCEVVTVTHLLLPLSLSLSLFLSFCVSVSM